MTLGNQFRAGYVALVGEANAGKSTLLNQLVGQKLAAVSPRAHTTRVKVLGVKTTNEAQLVYVDTPGFVIKPRQDALKRLLESETTSAPEGCDLVVLVLDSTTVTADLGSIQRTLKLLQDKGLPRPKIVALNKVDIVAKEGLLPVIAELSKCFLASADDDSQRRGSSGPMVEFVPVSAKSGDGVPELEKVIQQFLPEQAAIFPVDTLTTTSARQLAAECIREKLFLQLRDELPYSAAVQVETFEEDGDILRLSAVIMVERDSQKGIVIGERGSMLKKIGTAARQELEKFHDCKVFLELLVKVEPNWSASEAGIRKVGINDEL